MTAGAAGDAGAGVIPVGGVGELDVWQALQVLRQDFEAATAAELAGRGSAAYHVRQAGLETVVADRMQVWAVISVHRALRAGASVAELARATGLTCEQVAQRWRAWADGQRWLNECWPGLGLGVGEYERVASMLGDPGSVHSRREGRCGSSSTQAAQPGEGK